VESLVVVVEAGGLLWTPGFLANCRKQSFELCSGVSCRMEPKLAVEQVKESDHVWLVLKPMVQKPQRYYSLTVQSLLLYQSSIVASSLLSKHQIKAVAPKSQLMCTSELGRRRFGRMRAAQDGTPHAYEE
jgi:uncharacterized protein YbbC (DUF1343 family)